MKIRDMEFQNGVLVKIRGMRPEYQDGYTQIQQVKALAAMVIDLQHQLAEVAGTVEEYEQMPCTSLRTRMFAAKNRAITKMEELK